MNSILEFPKAAMAGIVASWEVVNKDGSIARACYNPKHNLILDCGLDLVAKQMLLTDCFAYFAIGTGTSAAAVAQTNLDAETTYLTGGGVRPASSGYPAYNDTIFPTPSSDPYVVIYQIGIQTSIGQINGTFTEIGFGPENAQLGTTYYSGSLVVGTRYRITNYVSDDDFTNVGAASNGNGVEFVATGTTPTHWAHSSALRLVRVLFSRFRLVDSGGVPTSVTVSLTQQLRIKYQLNIRFLPIVPTAYTTNMIGISATFGYTAGWQTICETSSSHLSQSLLALFGTYPTMPIFRVITSTPITFVDISAAKLASSVTYTPNRDSALTVPNTRDAYVDGSCANYINFTLSTLEAVATLYGIMLFGGASNAYINWLCVFDTAIVKPDTHMLEFKLKFTWGRDV